MSLKRISAYAPLALFALLLATPSFGQGPLGMQLFAPADVSTFGGLQEPNEGYFFQFDILWWSISRPQTQTVGDAALNGTGRLAWKNNLESFTQYNNLTTGDMDSKFSLGTKYEFGRVEDGNGWLCNYFELKTQVQDFEYANPTILFAEQVTATGKILDGPVPDSLVDLPVPLVYYNVKLHNRTSVWGTELMYLHRAMTCHEGSTFEILGGLRFIDFLDKFNVEIGEPSEDQSAIGYPSVLQNSAWYTQAENRVFGPQIGLRWFKKQGRWMLSSEGRFLAGFNAQTIRQQYQIGDTSVLNPTAGTDYIPSDLTAQGSNHSAFASEFSPTVELRAEARYQMTRALSLHAGWTGLWIGNVARANAVVDYYVPTMGIDMTKNTQNLLMNGLTLGIDFNR